MEKEKTEEQTSTENTATSTVAVDAKQKNDGEKKDKRYLLIIVFLCCVIAGLLLKGYYTTDTKVRTPKVETATKIEKGMSNEELQKLLDQKVKDGMMNANYSTGASFKGVKSESFNIKNIPNNKHDIQFAIFDENNEQLYQSGSIKRGYEINEIELTKALSKGKHNGKIAIWYVENGKQLGNIKSTFPIELWFK